MCSEGATIRHWAQLFAGCSPSGLRTGAQSSSIFLAHVTFCPQRHSPASREDQPTTRWLLGSFFLSEPSSFPVSQPVSRQLGRLRSLGELAALLAQKPLESVASRTAPPCLRGQTRREVRVSPGPIGPKAHFWRPQTIDRKSPEHKPLSFSFSSGLFPPSGRPSLALSHAHTQTPRHTDTHRDP